MLSQLCNAPITTRKISTCPNQLLTSGEGFEHRLEHFLNLIARQDRMKPEMGICQLVSAQAIEPRLIDPLGPEYRLELPNIYPAYLFSCIGVLKIRELGL